MGAAYSQGDINQFWSQVQVKGDANMIEVGKDGNIRVYELNGNGTCQPLPGKIDVSTRNKELQQKRVFMTVPGDKRNLRLYIDNECDTRANEEAYMKKTTLNNQNILHFPATNQQNAGYYKINETEPNKPPLPFFMVSPDEGSKRRFAAERAVSDCRPIPYVNSGENFSATANKAAAFKRELSNLTLYTDSQCTNIYAQTQEEIDRADNSYVPYSTTTNPYTNVKGYGGRVMEKTNARYYKIKDEKWNVINDMNPAKLAAATADRVERERVREEREERERQEAFQRRLVEEQAARERALHVKKAAQAAAQAASDARAKAALEAEERARAAAVQSNLAKIQEAKRVMDAINAQQKHWNKKFKKNKKYPWSF